MHFRGRRFDCPFYDRDTLPLGTRLDGPLIVEELGSTTVVWPTDRVHVDDHGNLRLEVGEK